MSGLQLVLGLITAGAIIAYIGDRIGMKVGRKRLTLFQALRLACLPSCRETFGRRCFG
mgnify:CR=1 FL=1